MTSISLHFLYPVTMHVTVNCPSVLASPLAQYLTNLFSLLWRLLPEHTSVPDHVHKSEALGVHGKKAFGNAIDMEIDIDWASC